MLMSTKKTNLKKLMTRYCRHERSSLSNQQSGFSLVELMVGLVIGLLVTLVITQTFSVFEGQKRSSTGTADAQTNGNIALYNIQRDVQVAGFGLPAIDADNSPFKCGVGFSYDDPDTPAVESIALFPISIADGGAGSDEITVAYGNSATAGLPTKLPGAPSLPVISVGTNIGCRVNDVAVIVKEGVCATTKVVALTSQDKIEVIEDAGGTVAAAATAGASISCLGTWQSVVYEVANSMLLRNGEPSVAEIVNIQAQYGVSDTAGDNKVTAWVNPVGTWAEGALTEADRTRIKAVRVAVVARNGLLEKTNVTAAAPIAWADTLGSAAPLIDLTADADWQRYRYRVYETIIPLRNMIWSKNQL